MKLISSLIAWALLVALWFFALSSAALLVVTAFIWDCFVSLLEAGRKC